MSLPKVMQKGLTVLFQVVKLKNPRVLYKAAETLEQHFKLSSHEIAAAYQSSYKSALKAIITGLGKKALVILKLLMNLLSKFSLIIYRHLPLNMI